MRIATITGVAPDCFDVRVYEAGHAAASADFFKRSYSVNIESTEIAPLVARLTRFANSYEGPRSPLSISDKCDAEQSICSANAVWLMRPSIQSDSRCGLSMGKLCHWQSLPSSQKLCCREIDSTEFHFTFGVMGTAPTKRKIKAIPAEKQEHLPLHLGEWMSRFDARAVDIAKAAGVGQSYISSIISGKKPNPRFTILVKITDHLGISVNDLTRPPPPSEEFDRVRKLTPTQQLAAQVLAAKSRRRTS
jgi:hypothetical protein